MADPHLMSGASSNPQAPLVLAETTVVTVVTVDSPVTATTTTLMVWAVATGLADTRVLSMVHTAAMVSAATHLAVDSEVFTAKAPQVLLVPLDLALSYLLDLHAEEADPAVLAE